MSLDESAKALRWTQGLPLLSLPLLCTVLFGQHPLPPALLTGCAHTLLGTAWPFAPLAWPASAHPRIPAWMSPSEQPPNPRPARIGYWAPSLPALSSLWSFRKPTQAILSGPEPPEPHSRKGSLLAACTHLQASETLAASLMQPQIQ